MVTPRPKLVGVNLKQQGPHRDFQKLHFHYDEASDKCLLDAPQKCCGARTLRGKSHPSSMTVDPLNQHKGIRVPVTRLYLKFAVQCRSSSTAAILSF
jgi:hypothetical protein